MIGHVAGGSGSGRADRSFACLLAVYALHAAIFHVLCLDRPADVIRSNTNVPRLDAAAAAAVVVVVVVPPKSRPENVTIFPRQQQQRKPGHRSNSTLGHHFQGKSKPKPPRKPAQRGAQKVRTPRPPTSTAKPGGKKANKPPKSPVRPASTPRSQSPVRPASTPRPPSPVRSTPSRRPPSSTVKPGGKKTNKPSTSPVRPTVPRPPPIVTTSKPPSSTTTRPASLEHQPPNGINDDTLGWDVQTRSIEKLKIYSVHRIRTPGHTLVCVHARMKWRTLVCDRTRTLRHYKKRAFNLRFKIKSVKIHLLDNEPAQRSISPMDHLNRDNKPRPVQVDVQEDKLDNAPLHSALERGDKNSSESLLRSGVDPNAANSEGSTPLHVICKRGHDDDLLALFFKINDDKKQTVQIDARDKSGNTPLHLALERGHKKAIEALLRRGADPNAANEEGSTSLHVIFKSTELFNDVLPKMLFELSHDKYRPVQVNAQDKLGNAPLHLAMDYGYAHLIELFLREGADPNLANAEGRTPLHVVCSRSDDDELARRLLEASDEVGQPVLVDARDKSGNTPLHLALHYDYENLMELLLRRGADPDSANAEGTAPLHAICRRYHEDDLAELFFKINDELNQTLQIDAKDNLGRTPLQLAVASLLPDTVDLLLDRGADLSSFVFPAESYFGDEYNPVTDYYDEFKLIIASATLVVVERLENRGYELTRGDARTIAKFFAKHALFGKSSSDLVECLRDDEFANKAKETTVVAGLSLLDLIRSRREEAAKLLACRDCFEFARTYQLFKIPERHRKSCAERVGEIVSRGFFRRWALDALSELTRRRLSTECCDKIVARLTNEDLWNICLATAVQVSRSR
ncbi:unnamed protein product [Trichogramma brassicae]|uniref:Uncharacterized protein n=1 Tax=Trichogramma brassicae TaxID=86971 RepID=A0A6H5J3B7_9HYME|nr:unnamed protein product [Trichogramma brassicae]